MASMFDIASNIVNDFEKVEKAMTKASFRNLGHAAASLRKRAIESIQVSTEPSRPGMPPHTKRRALPRAIVYKVDDDGAIIGPRHSRFGDAAQYHEFGGTRQGKDYIPTEFPPRPFMGPALGEVAPRMPMEWKDSLGG